MGGGAPSELPALIPALILVKGCVLVGAAGAAVPVIAFPRFFNSSMVLQAQIKLSVVASLS